MQLGNLEKRGPNFLGGLVRAHRHMQQQGAARGVNSDRSFCAFRLHDRPDGSSSSPKGTWAPNPRRYCKAVLASTNANNDVHSRICDSERFCALVDTLPRSKGSAARCVVLHHSTHGGGQVTCRGRLRPLATSNLGRREGRSSTCSGGLGTSVPRRDRPG